MSLDTLKRIASSLIGIAAIGLAVLMLVPTLAGFDRYVILTGSMAGTYDPGSIVYAKRVPVEDLHVGDVITYAPPRGESPTELVTHRIAKIRRAPDGRLVFRTRGDANKAIDPWNFTLQEPTQARVSFGVPYAGHLVMALADRNTRMLLIGGPALLIALLTLIRLGRDLRTPEGPQQTAEGQA